MSDPAPSADDAPMWAELLSRARPIDEHDPGGLYGLLRGLRAEGATLRLDDGDDQLELVLPENLSNELAARHLTRHQATLDELLARAAQHPKPHHDGWPEPDDPLPPMDPKCAPRSGRLTQIPLGHLAITRSQEPPAAQTGSPPTMPKAPSRNEERQAVV